MAEQDIVERLRDPDYRGPMQHCQSWGALDRLHDEAADLIATLRQQLAEAREKKEPDFCYDPHEWEYTCNWDDRNLVHGHGENLPISGPMEIATLFRGPSKWVADIPISWDDDGSPLDTEIKWFDSEEDAIRALSTNREGERG